MKVRRVMHDCEAPEGKRFTATCAATGEVLECTTLVPLLQRISDNIVWDTERRALTDPDAVQWTIRLYSH